MAHERRSVAINAAAAFVASHSVSVAFLRLSRAASFGRLLESFLHRNQLGAHVWKPPVKPRPSNTHEQNKKNGVIHEDEKKT